MPRLPSLPAEARRPLLSGVCVLDFAVGISGGYCTKLLVDAGADVVKVEPTDGDGLRGWSAGGPGSDTPPGVLFAFLNTSKRSVVGRLDDPSVQRLLAGADLLVESGQLSDAQLATVRAEHSRLVVVSMSNFGRSGPWRDTPANEFILQALCGSVGSRGTAETGPMQVGGRLGEWVTGLYAATAGIAALRGAERHGAGDHVDVSSLESMCITMGGYYRALHADMGGTRPGPLPRTVEVPSVEATADGLVGFCTVTRQQFQDFLAMIQRADLMGDEDLATAIGRQRHRASFSTIVAEWTSRHDTAQIVELASLLRIPVSPIGDPEQIPAIDHFTERGIFVHPPGGKFVQPRSPFLVDGHAGTTFDAAPELGADRPEWLVSADRAVTVTSAATADSHRWLSDLKVIDLTTFWAGPSATLLFACTGADVIKIESVQRPDGIRFSSTQPTTTPNWWDWSPLFQSVNLNKQSVTLDLGSDPGRALLARLIEDADLVIENYSPRVLDNFGITWPWIQSINPRTTLVRMPAFGLSGPWRDRTGFAQTMEQASGLAWMTGPTGGRPIVPRGPCDPIAGVHAAFAALSALRDRDRTGRGSLVEVPMIESALNVAAEMTLEHSAHGIVLQRNGNRGPEAAPQGTYRCAGDDSWLALAVMTDDQWKALRQALGDPEWSQQPSLDGQSGRRAAHDLIDRHLSAWCRTRDLDSIVAELRGRGIPAAPVLDPIDVVDHPQLRFRGFIETFTHPILGRRQAMGLPFRAASNPGSWVERPAPLLGQHNGAILTKLVDADRLAALAELGVIGTSPV